MKVIDFFRSKIILFLIQILSLSLFIYIFHYSVDINFDSNVSVPQELIIQVIANYVLFRNPSGMFFIYMSWIVVSLIPVILHNNFKKAYSMNLMTFFFPNFFSLTFLYNYSKDYFNSNFLFHFLQAILIGLIITLISLVLSIILKKIRKVKIDVQLEDMQIVANSIKSKCSNCGTEFDSAPNFCYNCNSEIILKPEENVEFK
jgi:predicted Zn-ribbon and HTH transcriptional regulator